jgi:tetratricopeptide (TPR) repeat protein
MRKSLLVFLIVLFGVCPLFAAPVVAPSRLDSLAQIVARQDSMIRHLKQCQDTLAILKSQRETSLDTADRRFGNTLWVFGIMFSLAAVVVSISGVYVSAKARRLDESRKQFDERLSGIQSQDQLLDARRAQIEAKISEMSVRAERLSAAINQADEDSQRIKEKRSEADANAEKLKEALAKQPLGSRPSEGVMNKLKEQERLINEIRNTGAALTAEDYYQRGRKEYYDSFYDSALISFERALSIQKDRADICAYRGAALGELNRMDEALFAFQKALRIDSKSTFAWTGKAIVLQNMERLDDALAAIEKAINQAPSDTFVLGARAYIVSKRDGYEAGLRTFDALINSAASKEDLDSVYLHRAAIHAINKERELMLADLKRAIDLNKDWTEYIPTERDFRPYLNDPDFIALVGE